MLSDFTVSQIDQESQPLDASTVVERSSQGLKVLSLIPGQIVDMDSRGVSHEDETTV